TVRSDGNVAGAEPFALVLPHVFIPDIIRGTPRNRPDELSSLQPIAGSFRHRPVSEGDISTGVGAQQHSAELPPQLVSFVDHDAGGRARADPVSGRDDPGILLAPVGGKEVLPRALIRAPGTRAIGTEVAEATPLHHPRSAGRDDLVVVVVLP